MPLDFPVLSIVIPAGHDPANADEVLGIERAERVDPIREGHPGDMRHREQELIVARLTMASVTHGG
jgi:hypothetical protein